MIVLVRLQDDALVEAPLRHLVRACAVGTARPVTRVRLDLLLVDDERRRIGELGEEVGLGLVDGDLERARVDDADAGDLVGPPPCYVLGADDVTEVRLGGGGRCLPELRGTIQGVFEVVGGDGLAVVESGVGADVEGVGQAIRADVPALGQVRDDLQVAVDGHEAAEYLDDIGCRAGIAGQRRIQRDRIAACQAQVGRGRRRVVLTVGVAG